MTARDYVSGAMENTTSTLHTDALQQDARQLTDGNKYEDYIAMNFSPVVRRSGNN